MTTSRKKLTFMQGKQHYSKYKLYLTEINGVRKWFIRRPLNGGNDSGRISAYNWCECLDKQKYLI